MVDKIGLNGPMTNRVKVRRYFKSLIIDMNNFAFEVKVILDLESTIPDGRPAGQTARRPAGRPEKLGIEPATARLELGLGLSLAKRF